MLYWDFYHLENNGSQNWNLIQPNPLLSLNFAFTENVNMCEHEKLRLNTFQFSPQLVQILITFISINAKRPKSKKT